MVKVVVAVKEEGVKTRCHPFYLHLFKSEFIQEHFSGVKQLLFLLSSVHHEGQLVK